MALDTTISLTTVNEFLSFMGIDYLGRSALWVYYDGVSLTATVEVEDAKIVLTDTVNGATDITFVAFATLTAVVNQINTIGGWHAGLIYIGTFASSDLIITGSLDTHGANNKQTLNIKDTHLIEQLINRASDFLNHICGRVLKSTTYAHERYDGGEQKIFLKNWPVSEIVQVCSGKLNVIKIKCTSTTARNAFVGVSSVVVAGVIAGGVYLTVDGVASGAIKTFAGNLLLSNMITAINGESGTGWNASIVSSAYNNYPSDQLFKKLNRFALNQDIHLQMPDQPLDGYEIDYNSGILYLPSTFGSGWRNVFVSYDGGYASTAIPDSLEQICIELVKLKYDQRKQDRNLSSETIGKVYKYTKSDLKDALPSDLMAELELFKSRDF